MANAHGFAMELIRAQWSNRCLRQMCKVNRQSTLACKAQGTVGDLPLTIKEKCILESHRSRRNVKDLPHEIEFAIGMKVMVTNNLETDLAITKRS
jgi:hypothetical protein